MTPHWRRHLERQEREREARRVSREYRQAQREAKLAAQPHKVCTGCKQLLPLSAYSPKGHGKFNARCRPCHSAKQAARNRAKRLSWTAEEAEQHRAADRAGWYARQGRAGETGMSLADRAKARAAAKAARLIEFQQLRQAERAEAKAALSVAKAARAAETEARHALARAEAVARRQMELEAAGQDMAEVELALACAAALEAQQKAQELATIAAVRAAAQRRRQEPYVHPTLAQRLAHLWPRERPLNVALKDGTRISTGQLASRHWWREQGRRFPRYSRHWS